MSDGEPVTIGQAVVHSGVSAKAIRLYEARGLLPQTARTATGHRLFHDEDLEVLDFIARAKSAGLRLSEIKTVLELQRTGHAPCGHVMDVFDERVAEIDSTMQQMAALGSGSSTCATTPTAARRRPDCARSCRSTTHPASFATLPSGARSAWAS